MSHSISRVIADAIITEFDKAVLNSAHRVIEISIQHGTLSNGIRHCCVQIQCGGGCGCRFETYGQESDVLLTKAKEIRLLLQTGAVNPSMSRDEILRTLFPELQLETELATVYERDKLG
jgi:hypothetical protein